MRYENSVVVNRPIEEVWAFLTNFFNVPRAGRYLAVRQTSPGPMGIGSTIQGRRGILGFETRVSGVITEWDPPHLAAGSIVAPGWRSGHVRLTLEANADGTTIATVTEFEPRPALKPLWWILVPLLRRQANASYRKFKRLLEAGGG